MSRTPFFDQVARTFSVACFCNDNHLSTADGLAQAREAGIRALDARHSRRDWLKTLARAGAAGAAASVMSPIERILASQRRAPSVDVGIVGAGLAGLACADALAASGVHAAVYDAEDRAGGRCASLRNVFPGQVAERGGEFIDNPHKTMIGYARRFGLAVEDVTKAPGDVFYHFGGLHVPEAAVVDEFRDFVRVMRLDLQRLSTEVTAFAHSPTDIQIDRTSLRAYLEGANGAHVAAGPIARAAISAAYVAEYGLETDQQSCLNFLLFIHADRRSKFTPFGVFSDERYHIADGNDRIVDGLAGGLSQPIELGMMLIGVHQTASGRVELTFDTSAGVTTRTHDAVVLAIPFTTLRHVQLDLDLDAVPGKRAAIDGLGYGTNAKMMVGFEARPWITQGSNGTSYSDLANLLCTWETNPAMATSSRGVMTDYSGGTRGASMNTNPLKNEVGSFLADLNLMFPGAQAAARRERQQVVAHLEHWPSNPFALGSYTCYQPGQFTTIAGLEGVPVGSVFFAGEHANSFYEWQGFMEGAALSGLDVAAAILTPARR